MQLRKLYRTIENSASRKFDNDEDLLKQVLQEVVQSEEIKIRGGRIWKFDSKSGCYILLHQIGDMEAIRQGYSIKLKDYPIFLELPERRTVLGSEQDTYLRKRGILKYSATGVGEKVKWRGHLLYRYVFAFNADHLDDSLTSTLNIISTSVTSVLRTKKVEHKARVLERDLDKAREIQQSILPQHEMRFHSYELYGVSMPDRIVGGDFFDYLVADKDQERLGIVIADAASKGLSAAAQALYTSGALRMGFDFHTKISWLLTRVNKLLNRTFSEEQFVTLAYIELTDDRNGLVLYANCGHNNPILLHADGAVESFEATGQILGPFPNEHFRTESFHMKGGDILILYTDGLSEAVNEQGEFFGEERIADLVRAHRTLPAKEISLKVLEEVQRFNANGAHSDDKTIVTIKRNN